MPLLESFVHISTSFCQCGESVLEERAYQNSVSSESIVRMINTMTDEELKAMTPQLLINQPNTYAYSKALSEDFVSRSGLPVGIVRPSIGIKRFPKEDSRSLSRRWYLVIIEDKTGIFLII